RRDAHASVGERRVDVAAGAALRLEDLLELTVGADALGHAHLLALRIADYFGLAVPGRVRSVAEADRHLIALEPDLDARVDGRALLEARSGDAADHEVELIRRVVDRLRHDRLGLLARLVEAPRALEAALRLGVGRRRGGEERRAGGEDGGPKERSMMLHAYSK